MKIAVFLDDHSIDGRGYVDGSTTNSRHQYGRRRPFMVDVDRMKTAVVDDDQWEKSSMINVYLKMSEKTVVWLGG